MARHFHGSDLEEIEKVFGVPKESIISFAANVNPLGIPESLATHIRENPYSVGVYPDREYTALKSGISEYCGVETSNIFVGSGATELISRTIEVISPGQVLIIEPTYSEYARKLSGEHARMISYELNEARDFVLDVDDFCKYIPGCDLIMICNPNNPTSTAIPLKDIRAICNCAKNNNCFVIIDETYVEFSENINTVSGAGIIGEYDNLAVLRGTSKFFATPGLRLGYMLCKGEDFKERYRKNMDPWSVNSIAATSGEVMFRDQSFIENTRAFIDTEMNRMITELSKLPFYVYKPHCNFVLLRIEKEGVSSGDIFEHCIKQGLMIRDCTSFKGLGDRHIRLCLNTRDNNDRLIHCLRSYFLE